MWMGVGVKETAGLALAKSGQPRSNEIRVASPKSLSGLGEGHT
jgi:hypothetical protein